jgi:hypothetical protein
MISRSRLLRKPIAAASVLLASIVLVACEQSKQAAPAPAAAASSAATTEPVFVIFQGPWAFATDPKDANKVLALAPKTKLHRDLYVAGSNDSTLAAGVYDLSVPAHGAATSGALDPSFAQSKIDAKSLQHVLDDKSGRYVIRLPKPEAYVAASRHRSRLGASYPPDVSTEQNYVTAVSLRYSVSSLSGFSLAGTPDSGTFKPLLLQVDTPTVSFVIDPVQADDPFDLCKTHSREAFHHLTKLLNLTLYVDFPESPSSCHDKDPQKSRAAKAEGVPSRLERMVALLEGNLVHPKAMTVLSAEISVSPLSLFNRSAASGVTQQMAAAFYFLFARPAGACTAPILILTTTP